MKAIRGLVISIHAVVGLGALAGGLAAVTDPSSPMGMSTEALKNGPFEDFLIPGLFLLCVIGLGNLAAGLLAVKKNPYYGVSSGAIGAVLMVWILVQCYILQAIVSLHVIFFLIGAVQGCLALALIFKQDLFPARLIKKILSARKQAR